MTTAAASSPTGVLDTAYRVRTGSMTARSAVETSLDAIGQLDGALNCFTAVLRDRALATADTIDAQVRAGRNPGPLAGVPFAVKNLFDIEGVTTIAGSKIHAELPPASRHATAVERLIAAGAVLVGALNMDEYAFGFTTENTHYGPTRNPHNVSHVAGGSSGGSAAAVASGMVPLTLGSDTNGSIRVPAAFCGVFGLKPTYGRVSRAGTLLFAESFDHVGPFARSSSDLAMAFDVLHGPDPRDPVCSTLPPFPTMPELERGCDTLRIAVATDYFARQGYPEAFGAVRRVADALKVTREVVIPEAALARAAAYIITACEGGQLHLRDLKTRPQDFDPLVVERFMAGALLPSTWYAHAQRFRSWFRDQVRALFDTVDVILAPTTPCPATEVGQDQIVLDGMRLPARPTVGIFTQPLSFIGLPIVSVPIQRPGQLPLGVQVIAAPYQEANALRVARMLEHMGIVSSPVTRPS